MSADLVIRNALLVSPEASRHGAVAVSRGRIFAIGRSDAMPSARRVIDAGGRPLIPGALDVHVHVRDPGFTYKETWATATAAAAVGGVTTIFDMPNTNPPTATAEALRDKIAIAASQAHVDFGVYGYVGERNIGELAAMAQAGACGFKLLLGSDNPLVPAPNDGAVLEALAKIAQTGLRCTVHAENNAILRWREAKIRTQGRDDLSAHLDHHTDVAAVEAIQRVILLSEWTGAKIHIAHENCRHALPLIAAAKRRGIDITAETCPHYLFLSVADAARAGGNALRVKPPVRDPSHAGPLWKALLDGTLDILSTDHAPHTVEEKNRASVWETAPGFSGVEISMRLMLTQVAAGRLSLERYVAAACAAPARAFGLWPRKGALCVGADADMVLLDLEHRAPIRGADFKSLGKVTPFEGVETIGRAGSTFLRGELIAHHGEIVSPMGRGRSASIKTVEPD